MNDQSPANPEALLQILDAQGIAYELHRHEAVFSVAESAHLNDTIPGVPCRNLFVRDKKSVMFLITAPHDRAIDLKKLEKMLGCGRLSFGSPDRLWQYLGVRPGSVCPFAVINDKDNQVQLVLDKEMMQADLLHAHPLENTMSVALDPRDLSAFCRWAGHEPLMMDLRLAAPDA